MAAKNPLADFMLALTPSSRAGFAGRKKRDSFWTDTGDERDTGNRDSLSRDEARRIMPLASSGHDLDAGRSYGTIHVCHRPGEIVCRPALVDRSPAFPGQASLAGPDRVC